MRYPLRVASGGRTWCDRYFRLKIGESVYRVVLSNGTHGGGVWIGRWSSGFPRYSEVFTKNTRRRQAVLFYRRLRRPGGLETYLMERLL